MAVQITDLVQALQANGVDKLLIRQGSEDKQIDVSDLVGDVESSFTPLNGTDLDTVTATGFYHVRSGVNTPPSAGNQTGYMIVIESDIAEPIQIYYDELALTPYVRKYDTGGSSWGNWTATSGIPTTGFVGGVNAYGMDNSLLLESGNGLYGQNNVGSLNYQMVRYSDATGVQFGTTSALSQLDGSGVAINATGSVTVDAPTMVVQAGSTVAISSGGVISLTSGGSAPIFMSSEVQLGSSSLIKNSTGGSLLRDDSGYNAPTFGHDSSAAYIDSYGSNFLVSSTANNQLMLLSDSGSVVSQIASTAATLSLRKVTAGDVVIEASNGDIDLQATNLTFNGNPITGSKVYDWGSNSILTANKVLSPVCGEGDWSTETMGYNIGTTTNITQVSMVVNNFITNGAGSISVSFRVLPNDGSETSEFSSSDGSFVGTAVLTLPDTTGAARFYMADDVAVSLAVPANSVLFAYVDSVNAQAINGISVKVYGS